MLTRELEKYCLLNVGEKFEFNGFKGTALTATTVVFKVVFGSIVFDLSKHDGVLYLGSESKAVFSLDRGFHGRKEYDRTIGVNCRLVENTDL